MKKEEARQKTIASLLRIARKHFTENGYYDVSLEKIAEEGHLTRGALYHHFKNKKGLFLAVLDLVQQDIANQIEKEALKSEDLWQQLILGCLGFIKAANAKDCRRILLVDAPAVVGWDAWRKVDQENSMDVLFQHIEELKNKDYLVQDADIRLMTTAVSGALNELVLNYPTDETADVDEKMTSVVSQLVKGFQKESNP